MTHPVWGDFKDCHSVVEMIYPQLDEGDPNKMAPLQVNGTRMVGPLALERYLLLDKMVEPFVELGSMESWRAKPSSCPLLEVAMWVSGLQE